jgi:hypothetical protein
MDKTIYKIHDKKENFVYNNPDNRQQATFTLTFDNPYISEDYADGNIKIIDLQNKSNKCLVFCSGNGLYFPNIVEEYTHKIRMRNRYEWENIAKNKIIQNNVSKIIFIRDIFKQWYVTGINDKINSIEKLAKYLEDETNGYEITIIGNSAGGYIAVLLGALIRADIIITVCGQYNLWDLVDKNPLLKQHKDEMQYSKYYDIRNFIKAETNILYFVPIKSKEDIPQYESVKDNKNIKTFRFNSKKHGLAEICGINYPYLLTYNKKKIEALYLKNKTKIINPYLFFVEKKIMFFQPFYTLKKVTYKLKEFIIKAYKSKTYFI